MQSWLRFIDENQAQALIANIIHDWNSHWALEQDVSTGRGNKRRRVSRLRWSKTLNQPPNIKSCTDMDLLPLGWNKNVYLGELWLRPWKKNSDAGKDWGKEEKGATEDGIIDSMDMILSKLWEIVKDRKAWHATVHRFTESCTRLSDCTTIYDWDRGKF